MMDLQTKLREEAKRLLEEKKVDVVIGYEDGSMALRTTPCFVKDPRDVE